MVVCIAGVTEVEESSGWELKSICGLQNVSFLRTEGAVDVSHRQVVAHLHIFKKKCSVLSLL